MKKITLLAAAIAFSFSAVAQTVIVDRPANDVNSLISTSGNDATGVYCADQFEITEDIFLGELDFYGTNSNGGALGDLLLGFNVVIYADVGGLPAGNPDVPGNGLVELFSAPVTAITDDAGTGNFTLAFTDANGGSQITLPAGLYWLSVSANVDSAPAADGRWNWALSDATPAVEPLLIDPQDLFGAGATDWSNIAGLIGAAATGMGWQLRDEEELLSVNDSLLEGVAVYPNPATDVVNIKVPSSVELTGVSVYDVLGKKVNTEVSNGQVNVSGLSRGVYVINVVTNAGTMTEKLIIE